MLFGFRRNPEYMLQCNRASRASDYPKEAGHRWAASDLSCARQIYLVVAPAHRVSSARFKAVDVEDLVSTGLAFLRFAC